MSQAGTLQQVSMTGDFLHLSYRKGEFGYEHSASPSLS